MRPMKCCVALSTRYFFVNESRKMAYESGERVFAIGRSVCDFPCQRRRARRRGYFMYYIRA